MTTKIRFNIIRAYLCFDCTYFNFDKRKPVDNLLFLSLQYWPISCFVENLWSKQKKNSSSLHIVYGGVNVRPIFSTEPLKHFVWNQIECIRTVWKAYKTKTDYNKRSKKHLINLTSTIWSRRRTDSSHVSGWRRAKIARFQSLLLRLLRTAS